MMGRINKILLVFSLAMLMSLPRMVLAENQVVVEEKPSALAMTGDLLIARPALLVITAVGTVVFVASLPFSLLGGNSGEAAQELVLKPAEATFVRCLGCKNPGYKKQVEKIEGAE